jgi:3-phenylpropionate/trans-cinnamate dioxygenase ferredoxin subunit
MSFVQVTTIEQIPPNSMKAYTVNGRDILITSYEDNYYAMDLKCTHMGGNLSKGKLQGKIITCPRHGSEFDITTGKCISGPRLGIFKPKIKDENVYAVKIEGNNILVDI